jgi:hypothetical protein
MADFVADPAIVLEEGLTKYEGQTASVLATLQQKNIVCPSAPMQQTANGVVPFRGELPHDLTRLTDNDLGTLLWMFSMWNDYVQFQLAEAQMNLSRAEAELELAAAKLRVMYKYDEKNKKRTEQERKDMVLIDRRYVDLQSNVLYFEALYRFIKAIANSAESAWQTISRRITQRGQDLERDRRNTGGPVFGGRR